MEQSATWINNAIQSCTNTFHLLGCNNLIELFLDMYREEGKSLYNELLSALMDKQTFLNIDI